ncbi:putative F-box/FBD/LRR-repeat protein At4g13965 [Arabidopsis lyrata subsp. lyrata]|uniref:putative F-box/FBD/LRR-repeat protein At4g13965 n=1 Tax=Arabidopsis lyrata subsp. lyrata TaxID=81972 RepID=UPI000A29E9C2|nr:putative F-box/FBD/LRR-repeat protein At4g13965 [Arabidopsis lyrata subsp. lyrata]|eukprot:XP_020881409.1 putative F-box/FBD/LRR-repeat protein At4g13965 [Arabidopsis lyrata subsp. lyrata]
MERCKKDGDNINNRDVVKEDRISELPEALILQILSLLPTEDAIATTTTVLSKRWQSLWKMLPNLKFDSLYNGYELGTFSKNVGKALLSYKAPVLQSLHLKISLDKCNAKDTAMLIGIAFSRNVRKLVLEVELGERFIFPESLYNCETLESLKVKFSVLMVVPSSVSLKSLRTLKIYYVDFKNNESVSNLFSGCPNLENLVVYRSTFSNVNTFTIAVPSLQRLTTCTSNSVDPHEGYVIDAPSLKYLKIIGTNHIGFFLIKNEPELVEANLTVHYQIVNENLLGSLTSIKRLSLEILPLNIKFPTRIIFHQLVYLEFLTNEAECWNLLTLMLDSSPKLQVLKLINVSNFHMEDDHVWKWNQPKNVPECLLFHLETFMWEGYKWSQEGVIEVVKYILSNTNCLKRATFSSKNISSEERVIMVKDLSSVVMTSNSCQLLIE